MKTYSVSKAIDFLAREYGTDCMPTNEETLRRAIRAKKLLVQKDGVPGRRGYCILESDLRAYAENKLKGRKAKAGKEELSLSPIFINPISHGHSAFPQDIAMPEKNNRQTELSPEVSSSYKCSKISPTFSLEDLYKERTKWETEMEEKKQLLEQLKNDFKILKHNIRLLEHDIKECAHQIDECNDSISKRKSN